MRTLPVAVGLFLSLQLASCLTTYANTAQKFNFFKIQSEKDWGSVIRGPDAVDECKERYQDYLTFWENGEWGPAANAVYNVSDCILTNVPEMRSKTMDSAAVLLGLTPILFSTLGPSLSELGLVSTQRPFLAMMFSLGTAAVFPSRVLSSYDDKASEILERRTVLDRAIGNWIRSKNSQSLCIVIGTLEYVVVALAVVNLIFTSWQLGKASVFTADCPVSFYPMIWSLLPIIVHLVASAAIHTNTISCLHRKQKQKARRPMDTEQDVRAKSMDQVKALISEPTIYDANGAMNAEPDTFHDTTNTLTPSYRERHLNWIVLQFMPSVAHPIVPQTILEPTKIQILLHNLATGLGFAQVIYGTIIFSSLLFVSTADAAIVILRYFASVVVCRLVLAFELGGMETEQDTRTKAK